MIKRRNFIGSLAAIASLPSFSNSLFAGQSSDSLPWKCDVIQSIPHGQAYRSPVVTGVSVQPGGSLVAIVGDDHHVGIYDLTKSKFVKDIAAHDDWIRTARFAPNGRSLATAGNDRVLKIWSADTFANPSRLQHRYAVIDVAFSSDSSKIATVGFSSELKIFNVEGRLVENRFKCACPDNHAVAFSSDDTMVAAGGRSGNIRVWDTNSGARINEIKAHKQRIRSIEFTDGGELVSCGDDQIVKISNPKTGQMRSLPRHSAKLFSTALLGNDIMATAGSDNKIHIWRVSNGEELGTLKGHTGTVSSLDFSKNKLASGSFDTQVRVWTIEPGSDPLGRQTRIFKKQR